MYMYIINIIHINPSLRLDLLVEKAVRVSWFSKFGVKYVELGCGCLGQSIRMATNPGSSCCIKHISFGVFAPRFKDTSRGKDYHPGVSV
jgi:hypothetical protein